MYKFKANHTFNFFESGCSIFYLSTIVRSKNIFLSFSMNTFVVTFKSWGSKKHRKPMELLFKFFIVCFRRFSFWLNFFLYFQFKGIHFKFRYVFKKLIRLFFKTITLPKNTLIKFIENLNIPFNGCRLKKKRRKKKRRKKIYKIKFLP